MRVQKVFIRHDPGTYFSLLYKQFGYRPYWAYFADTKHKVGMGTSARAAQHDARKRREGQW